MHSPTPAKAASVKRLERLDVLRFPLILLVVYIHAGTAGLTLGNGIVAADSDFVRATKYIGSDLVGRVAVPSLFFISGYLFFDKHSFEIDDYVLKIRSRFRSLFIPLIFWNILLFSAIFAAQKIPQTASYFSSRNKLLSSYSPFEVTDALIGISKSPIAYQFWFVRDLIILSLISPIIYLTARHLPRVGTALLLAIWASGFWSVPIPDIVAVACFFLGSVVAVNAIPLFSLDRYAGLIYLSYAVSLGASWLARDTMFDQPTIVLSRLAAIAAALCVTRLIVRSNPMRTILLALAPASFFMFAVHEPTLIIIRKIIYRLLHVTPTVSLLVYLIVPLVVAAMATIAYFRLRASAPQFAALISGGR